MGLCAQSYAESCEALIPRSLAVAIEQEYPGYRVPLEFDNAPDDIAYNRTHGGSGCLGVGTGDLTGEGKKDYVIGLTARKGKDGLAVIALPRKGGWRFGKIRSGSEDRRASQYVAIVPPGRYERSLGQTGPMRPGERADMVCGSFGVKGGAVDSTGIVYCYLNGSWAYVRVSD